MITEVKTFGTAETELNSFAVANPNAAGFKSIKGLSAFKVGYLTAPDIKYGSFLLRYDLTAYDNDYLYYGLETTNGAYRIRRVDRNQQQTWALGAWADRENLEYN